MNWIVIDFGSQEIKALKLRMEGQRLEILGITDIPAKAEYYRGLGLAEPAAWSAITIHLNEIEWLSADEENVVLAALPSAYLESRYLKFPFKNEKKIEKVLQFELESTLPFDLEEVLVRHRLLEGEGVVPSKEGLVLAYCYKRDLVKGFESELRKFQVSVPSITSEILALSTLRSAMPAEPVVALLEIGHAKSKLVLLQKNGMILGLRTLWWGGRSIIQAIAEDHQLEQLQAEARFWQLDPSQDQGVVASIRKAMLPFGSEIKQTLKSWSNSGIKIPSVIPTFTLGGVNRAPQFNEFLSESLSGEIQMQVRSFPLQALEGKHVTGLLKLEDPEKAISCLAIAMTQLRNQRAKVPSFSESGFQFQQNLQKIKSSSFSLLRKVAVLILIPLVYSIFQFYIQQKESKVTVEKLAEVLSRSGMSISPTEGTEQIMTKLKTERAKNRNKIDQLAEDDLSPLVILTQISEKIPLSTKIDVKSFKVTDQTITVTAETDSAASATKIAESVKALYPELKMGAASPCKDKANCQVFSFEVKRETL